MADKISTLFLVFCSFLPTLFSPLVYSTFLDSPVSVSLSVFVWRVASAFASVRWRSRRKPVKSAKSACQSLNQSLNQVNPQSSLLWFYPARISESATGEPAMPSGGSWNSCHIVILGVRCRFPCGAVPCSQDWTTGRVCRAWAVQGIQGDSSSVGRYLFYRITSLPGSLPYCLPYCLPYFLPRVSQSTRKFFHAHSENNCHTEIWKYTKHSDKTTIRQRKNKKDPENNCNLCP